MPLKVSMIEKAPEFVDLILLGFQAVGKTSLLYNFTDKVAVTETVHTVGVDFRKKNLEIDGEQVTVKIWDTAGQERFKSISSNYIRRANGVICVFSFNDPDSFDRVEFWINDAKNKTSEGTPIYLIGNKTDLGTDRIPREDIDELAKRYGLKYFETSAKTGKNVERVFTELAREAFQAKRAQVQTQGVSVNDNKSNDNDKGCCK